jgi:hypothetical protein
LSTYPNHYRAGRVKGTHELVVLPNYVILYRVACHDVVRAARTDAGTGGAQSEVEVQRRRGGETAVGAEKRTNLSRRNVLDIFVRCGSEAISLSCKSGECGFNPLEGNKLLLKPQIFTKPVITQVVE